MGITTGNETNASVTRIGRVGVLGHLDELERLSKEYCKQVGGEFDEFDEAGLTRRLALSGFVEWLRQRQRQSVAGDSDV